MTFSQELAVCGSNHGNRNQKKGGAGVERRELSFDGKTWAIELEGAAHKIVHQGSNTTRVFASPEKARRSFEEQIAARLQEGFLDTHPPAEACAGEPAPGLRAALAPEAVALTSRRSASLGQSNWPLHGSLEQIVCGREGNLALLTRTADSVTLCELDPDTGACLHTLSLALEADEHDKLLITARVSPDGRTLAVWGPKEAAVSLWDLHTATRTGVLTPEGSNQFGTARLTFSPDGSKLAVFSEGLQIFALPSGEEILKLPIDCADPLAFSPDGSQIAYVDGKQLHLQPLDGIPRVIQGQWPHGRQLAWSPTGSQIAVLAFCLYLVEVESGNIVLHELEGGNNEGEAVAFSADGSQVWVAQGSAPLVRVRAGKLQKMVGLGPQVNCLAWGEGEQHLYVGHGTADNEFELLRGELHRLDLAGPKFELLAEYGWKVLQADRSGNFLEQAPQERFNAPTRLKVGYPDSGRIAPIGIRDRDSLALIALRGGWVVGKLSSQQVSALDIFGGREPMLLQADRPESLSADARRLLVQQQEEAVVYRLDEFYPPRAIWRQAFKSAPSINPYGACALDPAGRRAVLTGPGSIQVYSLDEDRLLWEDEWSTEGQFFENDTRRCAETHVAVLGDGRFAVLCHAVGEHDCVTCWCMESGRKLGSKKVDLKHNRVLFGNLAQLWLPSAGRVLLPHEDGYLSWNLADGAEERTLPGPGGTWFASGYPVLSFDDRLVAVPEPGMVRIYSLSDGEQVDLIETGSENPVAMTWIPNSYRLVTRGPGSSYQVWRVLDDPLLPVRDEPPALGERTEPGEEEPVSAETAARAAELEAGLEWFALDFVDLQAGDLEALVHLARTSSRREVVRAALRAMPALLGKQKATPDYARAVLARLQPEDPALLESALRAASPCLQTTPPARGVLARLAELVFHHPEPRVRWLAMVALKAARELGPEVLQAAQAALADPHPRVVIEGMSLDKSRLSDPQKRWYLELLRPLLSHSDPLVRAMALRSALQIEESAAWLEQAVKNLQDSEAWVRVDAADVLKTMRYRQAIPALMAALPDEEIGTELKLGPLSEGRWFSRLPRYRAVHYEMLEALKALGGNDDLPDYKPVPGRELEDARRWYAEHEAVLAEQLKRAWEPPPKRRPAAAQEANPQGDAPPPPPARQPMTVPTQPFEQDDRALAERAARLEQEISESGRVPKGAEPAALLYLAENCQDGEVGQAVFSWLSDNLKHDREPSPGEALRRALMKRITPEAEHDKQLYYAMECTRLLGPDPELRQRLAELALSHPREWARQHAMEKLGNEACGIPEGLAALRAHLQPEAHPLLIRTALLWIQCGPEVGEETRRELLERVRPYLTHEHPGLRSKALAAALNLTRARDREILQGLEKALKDPDARVRFEAAGLCADHLYAGAIPVLATHGVDEAKPDSLTMTVEGPFGSSFGTRESSGRDRVDRRFLNILDILIKAFDLPECRRDQAQGEVTEQAREWYQTNRSAVEALLKEPAARS